MKTRFEFQFGIIEGCVKRALIDYIDERLFKQRKNYDEYTLTVNSLDVDIELCDLFIIAENAKITILDDCLLLSNSI